MPTDVMDQNGFNNTQAQGMSSFAVTAKGEFRHQLATLNPENLGVRVLQYEDYPHTISSYSWTAPNRYRAECVFMGAVYGALQGTDGTEFFAALDGHWRNKLDKWPLMTPSQFGQFPAAALLYRRGDVAEAATVIRQELSLDDLLELKGSGTEEPVTIDHIRAEEVPAVAARQGKIVSNIDPLAYYVGRVVRAFGSESRCTMPVDLPAHIDRQARTVRAANGQAFMDYGTGYVTVDSARSQGACGMLAAAGPLRLGDVVIRSESEYASVLVTAIDDAPLASANRVLVQVVTTEVPFGWETEPEGDWLKLLNVGAPPMNVLKVAGQVEVKRQDARSLTVQALDANGYPMDRPVSVDAGDESLVLQLEPDVLYYVIQAR
jgi:hypothetical protein